jgi:hypothetical protein
MIIPTIKAAAKQFAKQLKAYYEQTGDIIRSYYMYLGFIKKYGHHDLRQYTRWQVEAEIKTLHNDKIDNNKIPLETVDIRTRRGGKSRKLSNIAVFFNILGFRVIWRTPFTNQLDQAAVWFSMNPFVSRIQINQQHRVDTIQQEYFMNIGILSAAQSGALECNALIFDEGGFVEKHKKLFKYYKDCRPFVSSMHPSWIIHATTPAILTAVEEAWEEAKQFEALYNTQLTFFHTDEDCPWITEEWVEKERLLNLDTPWYVDQNYKCQWVTYGGSIFNNYVLDTDGIIKNLLTRNDLKIKAGVDFNGEITKHYLVSFVQKGDTIYILSEEKFEENDVAYLMRWQKEHPLASLELEEDLFNDAYANQARRMGLNCIYLGWNEAEKWERVIGLKNKRIVIDKSISPMVLKNLKEAAYDPKSRLPKLLKRTDQHGLDALLHADHDADAEIYSPQHPEPQASVFQKNKGRFLDYQG